MELKRIFFILHVLIVLVILIGCGLNDRSDKYIRFRSEECKRGVLTINLDNSEFCCDDEHHVSDYICVAAYDYFNHLFSSLWAFFLPLLPGILTLLSELADHTIAYEGFIAFTKRSAGYIAIIFYRSVFVITFQQYV